MVSTGMDGTQQTKFDPGYIKINQELVNVIINAFKYFYEGLRFCK